MEKSHNTGGVGLKNRYDALMTDECMDSLDALKSKTQNHPKKSKPKKHAKWGSQMKLKFQCKEQTQKKEKGPPAKTHTLISEPLPIDKKSNKVKLVNNSAAVKPTKPAAKKPVKKTVSPFINVPPEQQISLEEYKQSKAVNREASAPKYNLRVAGEGEDLAKWDNLVPLKNKNYISDDEMEHGRDACGVQQRAGRQRRLPDDVGLGDNSRRRGSGQLSVVRVSSSYCPESIRYQRPPRVNSEIEFGSLGQ